MVSTSSTAVFGSRYSRRSFLTVSLVALTLIGAFLGGVLVPRYSIDVLLYVAATIAVVVTTIIRPHLGLYLLVFTIPIQNLFQLDGGEVTLTRVFGVLVMGSWLLGHLLRRESWSPILSSSLMKPGAIFILFALASFLWADNVTVATSKFITIVQLLLLSILTISVVNSTHRLEWVVRSLVLGGLVAAIVTINQVFAGGALRAGDEVGGDVNATGNVLVVLVPFAFYLLSTSRSPVWKVAGMAYIALALLAVTLTLSRVSFIVLPIVLGLQLLVMFTDVRRHLLVTLLIVPVVAAVLIIYTPWDRVVERAEINLLGGSEEEDTSSGRFGLWLGAVAMFTEHPLQGVGIGNFGHQYRVKYQFLVPDKYLAPTGGNRSPHSTLLGFLAELGLIGIVLWTWLSAVTFLNLVGSAGRKNRHGAHSALVKALFIALIAYTIFSMFSVTDNHKMFWLMLGLSQVLVLLRLRLDEPSDAPITPETARFAR